ncbi:MAG: hypothetical protein DRN15_04530 [Thermoprotei archaeon]|nr:MAG: hypothetical protein DRM97_06300 [Thermoprotei archaeon]RLF23979.1 MAG: hypothetical protein DRN15_04530 [Thermoprotei archaeon]
MKVKIEEQLPTGEKISITIEGHEVNETRVLQVMELLKIMSGRLTSTRAKSSRFSRDGQLKDLLWDVISSRFSDGRWFTSKDVQEALTEEYGYDLRLSTISTYLLRFYQAGLLERGGTHANRRYRVKLSSLDVRA